MIETTHTYESRQNQAIPIEIDLIAEATVMDDAEAEGLGLLPNQVAKLQPNDAITRLNEALENRKIFPMLSMAKIIKQFSHPRYGTLENVERLYQAIVNKHEENIVEVPVDLHCEMQLMYHRRFSWNSRNKKGNSLTPFAHDIRQLARYSSGDDCYTPTGQLYEELLGKIKHISEKCLHVRTSNNLARAYGCLGMFNEAHEVLDRYKEKWDGWSYWAKIELIYCQEGYEAVKTFYQSHSLPDENPESPCESLLRISPSLSEARELYESFPEVCQRDDSVARRVIASELKIGNFIEAISIFENIDRPRQPTYQVFIRAHIRAEMFQCALELFQHAISLGYLDYNVPKVTEQNGNFVRIEVNFHNYLIKRHGTPVYCSHDGELCEVILLNLYEFLQRFKGSFFSIKFITGGNSESMTYQVVEELVYKIFGWNPKFRNHGHFVVQSSLRKRISISNRGPIIEEAFHKLLRPLPDGS